METTTGIIILNYNNSSDTINCVESIFKVNTAPIKKIIVDNGSQNEYVVILKKYVQNREQMQMIIEVGCEVKDLPEITLLLSKRNLGYAGGNNLGLKLADCDDDINNILIVNNDILFIEDIIPILQTKYEELDRCGILSPLLYTKDRVNIDYTCARRSPSEWLLLIKYLTGDLGLFGLSIYFDSKNYLLNRRTKLNKIIKVDLPSGSCMFINKELFRKINWFDEHTFLYYEENILYKKLLSYNKQNYIITSIGCIHIGASSTKSKPSSFLIKCNSDSAFYYLSHYCDLNYIQKCFLLLAKKVMYMKYIIFNIKEKQK